MKWKISLFVALIVGALAGSWIKNLPGFVIIAYETTTYEMRLWIAVCLILLLLALFLLVALLVRSFFSTAGKVKSWHGNRSWRIARKKTIQGMLAFTEGRWKASEDIMLDAAKSSDTKLINYLIAAQAAQQQNAEVRRDAYLRLAHQAEPAAQVAIGLTQAQLQLKQSQFEQALASLNDLKAQNPNHPYVLKLLSQLFHQLRDWEQLYQLLPSLKKQQVFQVEKIQEMEELCVAKLLQRLADKGDIEALQDRWQKLTNAQRKSRANQIQYCRALLRFGCMSEADSLLRGLLKKHADSELLALYGQLVTDSPAKQLGFLESWQQASKTDSKEVFLTLGKLAFNAKLWGKARQYLETGIHSKPSAEAFYYLAKTLDNLGDSEKANEYYQQGLEFTLMQDAGIAKISLQAGSSDLIQANLLPQISAQNRLHSP